MDVYSTCTVSPARERMCLSTAGGTRVLRLERTAAVGLGLAAGLAVAGDDVARGLGLAACLWAAARCFTPACRAARSWGAWLKPAADVLAPCTRSCTCAGPEGQGCVSRNT